MAERAARHGRRDDNEDRFYFLAREQFERYLVRLMINRCNGNREAAAKALGVSKSTIKNKVRGDEPYWTVAIRRAIDKLSQGSSASKLSSEKE